MKKLRILLADDHAMVREGLRLLINSQPHLQVIGEAGNGREALRKAMELKPHVVVMDLTMSEMNGLQATENLVAALPGIKVIALTVHEDAHYMRQLIRAGADGYVVKRSAAEQLIHAINTVAHGGVYFDATLAGKALTFSRSSFSDESHPRSTVLSEQETKVLTLMAWGYSNKEVATQLNLSVKTVETYKTRVTEKIGLRSRAEMVRYALRQGWLNDTPPKL